MLTKEELLLKGVLEDVADEIIASFSEDPDTSLQSLEKALDGPETDDLFKAGKGDEGEDEDEGENEDEDKEYGKKFMKKMKRYMKENKAYGDEMKKAVDDVNYDADAAIMETVDLEPVLKSMVEFSESLVKAIGEISENIEVVSKKSDMNYDLLQKSAKVQVEQAKAQSDFLSIPKGRKGVVANEDMSKAVVMNSEKNMNVVVHEKLMKAVMDKVPGAGEIISVFESRNKDIANMNTEQRKLINNIITREVK